MIDHFYTSLPTHNDFLAITDPASFTPVPSDWYVALTDVKNSTQAIQKGRYKDVNLVGASVIIALLNSAGKIDIPFVFGGDGASILLPPSLLEPAKAGLLAAAKMAQSQFGLELRLGLVPVQTILEANYQISVAKLRLSETYKQAMFTGGGLAYAERLLKEPATSHLYNLADEEITPQGDFKGLECRWEPIPSPHGETISLIVLATTGTIEGNHQIYRNVLTKLNECYGPEADYHPITRQNLNVVSDADGLLPEAKIRANANRFSQFAYQTMIWVDNLIIKLAIRATKLLGTNLDRLFKPKRVNVDYKKYDDTLRMIIAGTTEQRQCLTNYLETQYQAGNLVYGIHTSNRALMTCLVSRRDNRYVHFIDGADGGYALAAKGMKRQLQQRAALQQKRAERGAAKIAPPLTNGLSFS